MVNRTRSFAVFFVLLVLLAASSWLPKPLAESGGINITLYGFSVMKESLEKSVFPGFAATWKKDHGQDVKFSYSFAGSETLTNQILC